MIVAFVCAALVAVVIGLPVDWVRRRAAEPVAVAAGFGNALAVIAAVGAMASSGLVSGVAAVPALVFGLIAGHLVADVTATHWWGPTGKRA